MLETQTRPEPPTLTAAARLVAGALAEVHEVTVVELHESAGVSKSTVAKTLVQLERAGAACRTVRETGGVRDADLWSPGPGLGALLFKADVQALGSDCGDATERPEKAVVAPPACVPDDVATEGPASPVAPAAEEGTTSDSEPEFETGVVRPAEADAVTEAAATVSFESDESGSDGQARRLAPGELRAMVTAVLEAHPDIEYTPTMLSHMLEGRSAGAIHNVLEKLVSSGAAARTRDKPKSYRHVAAEAPNPA
ncbi:MarR family transcriptional regulator [Catenulispora rubra]|uniref:MarR family transcriptional regulator n=1 Tax=Catenulispora rubra TaxID=280293 RepID=UPI00189238DC|nr:MarR family transcriptional regulator [Catenulispora rubra]